MKVHAIEIRNVIIIQAARKNCARDLQKRQHQLLNTSNFLSTFNLVAHFVALCITQQFFKIYSPTSFKATLLNFTHVFMRDSLLNKISLTVSTCPIEYSLVRTKEVPYQNARAYDAQINRKAIPIEMLAVIAFFIPILLASSKFLLYLGEVTKTITYMHKSYEMSQDNIMVIKFLECAQPRWFYV